MPPCERLRMLVSKTIPLARGRNGILFFTETGVFGDIGESFKCSSLDEVAAQKPSSVTNIHNCHQHPLAPTTLIFTDGIIIKNGGLVRLVLFRKKYLGYQARQLK